MRKARPKSPLAWLSTGEVEGVIRAVGREPITPELADRVLLMFQPRILWSSNLERTRERLADREFVRRIDAAAGQALGRRANTFDLINRANRYRVGYDDAQLAHFFR